MTTDHQRFAGDRYQRLAQGAAILAADPAVLDASFPFNRSGLRAFIAAIVAQRILDDLSDCDANLVSMLMLLDFPFVPRRTAWRIQDVLPDEEGERRRGGNGRPVNEKAVAKALTAVLEVANATIPIPLLDLPAAGTERHDHARATAAPNLRLPASTPDATGQLPQRVYGRALPPGQDPDQFPPG